MCEKFEHWTEKAHLKMFTKSITEPSDVGRKNHRYYKNYIMVTFI